MGNYDDHEHAEAVEGTERFFSVFSVSRRVAFRERR